jgi:hypothetical protein
MGWRDGRATAVRAPSGDAVLLTAQQLAQKADGTRPDRAGTSKRTPSSVDTAPVADPTPGAGTAVITAVRRVSGDQQPAGRSDTTPTTTGRDHAGRP